MVLRVLASLFHVFYESGPRESTTKCFAAIPVYKDLKRLGDADHVKVRGIQE